MPEALTEAELSAMISREIASASNHTDSELGKKRRDALAYYRGSMKDVPAEQGRSSVVSRDVADTIGWMLPGIIRVFTASDRMAMCEPMQPEDEEFSEQASDGINYVFWKQNEGYRILYNATFDSLLFGDAVIKHWWDDTPETKTTNHSGLTDEQLAELAMDDAIEILAHTATQAMTPMSVQIQDGSVTMVDQPVTMHEVKIARTAPRNQIKIDCIPPENFLINEEARTIAEARFVGHLERRTRSELIEMGFDADKVDAIPETRWDDVTDFERGNRIDGSSAADKAMQQVDLAEVYIKLDMDGDGVAEMVRAYFGGGKGGTLLDWEVWEDETPFTSIPCTPMPHRWDSESIADETMDVQRVKTVLQRQMLDNLYATNIPTRVVTGEILNPEELFNPSFGGVIFAKGQATIEPLTVPFVADKALLGIEYMDQVTERRTGVSRSTMALDPEALQNQTATSVQASRDAAYSQTELVARNQAELGWKPAFRAILRLMVKHQDRPMNIRLRDKWVKMDPRSWNADMDVTINVGLGTGSRDRDMAMLNAVLGNQANFYDRFAAAGLMQEAGKQLSMALLTAKKIAESAGIRSPEQFYPELPEGRIQEAIQQAQEASQQPDPKLQIEQAKLQFDMQAKSADFQFRQQEMEATRQADMMRAEQDAQIQREKAAADINAAREKAANELQLKREQLVAEIQLKRELAMAEMQVKRELGAMGAQAKVDAATSGVEVGGEPG